MILGVSLGVSSFFLLLYFLIRRLGHTRKIQRLFVRHIGPRDPSDKPENSASTPNAHEADSYPVANTKDSEISRAELESAATSPSPAKGRSSMASSLPGGPYAPYRPYKPSLEPAELAGSEVVLPRENSDEAPSSARKVESRTAGCKRGGDVSELTAQEGTQPARLANGHAAMVEQKGGAEIERNEHCTSGEEVEKASAETLEPAGEDRIQSAAIDEQTWMASSAKETARATGDESSTQPATRGVGADGIRAVSEEEKPDPAPADNKERQSMGSALSVELPTPIREDNSTESGRRSA